MFWTFVLGAMRFRRRRLLLAFSGLAVAATLATALFSVYSDIERKMRSQFTGYGANLVIAPAGESRTVPLTAVAEAERLGAAAAPFIYIVGRLHGDPVVVTGVDFKRAAPLTHYWRVTGERSVSEGECLAGTTATQHFHLRIGQKAELAGDVCVVRGIVSTGGPEDNQILLPFAAVARTASLSGAASLVQVRADGQRLDQIRAALVSALPGADVRVVHAIAETEANVALKIRGSLFLLTVLILAITTLCVTGNFSALVIERSKEIGILKAIGAAEKRIAAMFLAESLLLALVSTIAGYAVGLGIAYWIGRQIFSGSAAIVGVDFKVLAPVAGITMAVALVATMLAASRIWRIEPARILRGE